MSSTDVSMGCLARERVCSLCKGATVCSHVSDRNDLPGCNKGLCLRKATRLASYRRSDGTLTAQDYSCDEHGIEPCEDLPHAEEARKWNRENAYWTG